MKIELDEAKVKSLFDQGLSNREIGERLGVSMRTIQRFISKQPWNVDKKTRNSFIMKTSNRLKKEDYSQGSIVNHLVKHRVENKDELLSDDDLLELHGYDPEKFKLKNAISSEWTTPMNGRGFHNYQTKINIEPKTPLDISPEELVSKLVDIKPIDVKYSEEVSEVDMYIPLSDMHFGHNSMRDYSYLLNELVRVTSSRHYRNVLISIHGDYFHVDNFLNTTERGTHVDEVDFENGVNDGYLFLTTLLKYTIENSNSVKLTYLPGNHAPSIDYMFVNAIRRLYPNIDVDDSIQEYKADMLGDVLIIGHHGDKIKNFNRLLSVMVSEFAADWGRAKSRYLFTGHFHHEKSLSEAGVTHYQVQSPSRPSSYDKKMGYITSESGQQVFTFQNGKRKSIIYI